MASINPLANVRAWSATYPLRNPRLAATIIAIYLVYLMSLVIV